MPDGTRALLKESYSKNLAKTALDLASKFADRVYEQHKLNAKRIVARSFHSDRRIQES